MPHMNKKPFAKNGNLVQRKTRSRMNYEWIWENQLEKNPIQKVEKNSKKSKRILFRRDQNHYSNLTSKIMKICEQIDL